MTRSEWWVLLAIVTGVALDIWVAVEGATTISEVARDVGYHAPILPYGLGMLCGHFWLVWLEDPIIESPWNFFALATVGVAFFAWAHLVGSALWLMATALFVGIAAGALLWPMSRPS